MHKYDVVLKSVLRRRTSSVLQAVSGIKVVHWRSTDLVAVQSRHADMLGEAEDGELLHVELQSTNQEGMALRMLEYAIAIRLQFGRFPRQVVLYVGAARLRMASEIRGGSLRFQCDMVDIREFDADALIASRRVEDNVIAILARLATSARRSDGFCGRSRDWGTVVGRRPYRN